MNYTIYYRPLILFAISYMAGIAAAAKWSGAVYPAISIFAVSSFLILCCIKKRKTAFLLPFFLFFSLGYLSISPYLSDKIPDDSIARFSDGGKTDISGVVVSEPYIHRRFLRFVLDAETAGADDRPVSGRIRVSVSGAFPGLGIGDRIRFNTRIRSFKNFENPGGFDYRRYMKFKGISASCYVPGKEILITENGERSIVSGGFREFRKKVREKISGLPFRHDTKAVLNALLTGDKRLIPDELYKSFSRLGISHLLAISGLHVGIVASAAFFAFYHMLKQIPFFLWTATLKKACAVSALFPVLYYGVLSGFSPSTQRAVIMVTVFMAAFVVERELCPFNTLGAAAFFILAIHPPSLFAISFQLSFAAAGFIILGVSALKIGIDKDDGFLKRFLKWAGNFFLVSLFAFIGTFPLVMYYFNQISFAGLVTNYIFIPLIGFVVVPVGLFSVLILPVCSPASEVILWCAGFVLDKSINVAGFISEFPVASFKTVTPSVPEIVCLYLLAASVITVVSAYLKKNTGEENAGHFSPKHISPQTLRWSWGLLIVSSIILSADAGYWYFRRHASGSLRVTVLDVGQGSAAAVEMPGGGCVLVDGGGFSDNASFDVGEKIVARFLWHKKIRTVDSLYCTHPQSDHLNGLFYIASYFNVKRVFMNNDTPETAGFKKFMNMLETKHINKMDFQDLPRTVEYAGATMDILYPPGGYDRMQRPFENCNNNSLVIKLTYNNRSVLFAGDIEKDAEEELVQIAGDRLKSDVLVAPHHGSRTSSTSGFINAVSPEAVIFSAGWNNRFHFPHLSVIKRYKNMGIQIYRTDKNGAVSVDIRDGRLKLCSVKEL